MTTATRLTVLDPTVEPIPVHAIVAQRPTTLNGKTVGLLANGKRNAGELLEAVYEVLSDRFEFAGAVVRNKGNASRPCPASIIEEMADQCDVVITASGD
jgi:hypothetical protein